MFAISVAAGGRRGEFKHSAGDVADVIQLGPKTFPLPELPPMGSVAVKLQYLVLKSGVQKLPEVAVHEAGTSTPLDTLALSVKVR